MNFKAEITINPAKAFEFQRNFCNNAIKQTTAKKLSEIQRLHKEDLRLTPIEIGMYLKRLRLITLEDNLLGRFIDGFV